MFGISVEDLLGNGGWLVLLVIGGIVFAESGLLIGFFLPGDTLLFSAGVFAARGKLHLTLLLIIIVVAAIVGDNVGYSIGRRTGPRIFKKKDGVLFRQEYIQRAEAFYEKHGGKTIILARFVPVVRTFAPIVAGAAKMPRKRFMLFNMLGAGIWGVGVTMLGYLLGSQIDSIDKYLLPAVGVATVFTFGPAIYHVLKERENRVKLDAAIRKQLRRIIRRIGLNRDIDI